MRFWDEMSSWLRRTGIIVVGWALVLGGIAALVLPGPGLLLLLAGLIVLSQEYEWAERRLEPVRIKAFTTAAASVQTWPGWRSLPSVVPCSSALAWCGQ